MLVYIGGGQSLLSLCMRSYKWAVWHGCWQPHFSPLKNSMYSTELFLWQQPGFHFLHAESWVCTIIPQLQLFISPNLELLFWRKRSFFDFWDFYMIYIYIISPLSLLHPMCPHPSQLPLKFMASYSFIIIVPYTHTNLEVQCEGLSPLLLFIYINV